MLTYCLYRELRVKMEYLVYVRSRTFSCTVTLYMVSNVI